MAKVIFIKKTASRGERNRRLKEGTSLIPNGMNPGGRLSWVLDDIKNIFSDLCGSDDTNIELDVEFLTDNREFDNSGTVEGVIKYNIDHISDWQDPDDPEYIDYDSTGDKEYVEDEISDLIERGESLYYDGQDYRMTFTRNEADELQFYIAPDIGAELDY